MFKRRSLITKLTYETLLEIANKLELSENEKEETNEQLNQIKSWYC